MQGNQCNPNWYVAYTFPNAERKAAFKLKEMGVDSFLPLHKVVRQWSDRKKKLEVPLFPNYIFIYVLPQKRFDVLKIKELVKFVSFERKPAIIPEALINSLKNILSGDIEISNENFCEEGMKVTIRQGQFAGAEGILVRKNGKARLLIQIEALHTHVSVDISANYVEAGLQ